MTFCEKLLHLRKKKNLTQKQLAKNVGLNVSTYAMYEQGHREPDFKTLETLYSYFNVSPNYLLGYSDESRLNENNTSNDFLEYTKEQFLQDCGVTTAFQEALSEWALLNGESYGNDSKEDILRTLNALSLIYEGFNKLKN